MLVFVVKVDRGYSLNINKLKGENIRKALNQIDIAKKKLNGI